MAFSSAIKQFASVHTKFNKTIGEALTRQIEIETSLDRNDTIFDAREQRNSFERTVIDYERAVDGYVKETADYLIKLKTRLNSLVFINRLPIELLSRIILFTIPKGYFEGWRHYITYTWVCHHWRSVLIQTADLWTSVHLELKMKPVNGFVHEILRRSKSAKLDIKIVVSSSSSTLYTSILEGLAKESHRIHTLWLEGKETDGIESIFRGKRFPSLKRVVYNDWGRRSGLGFIPMIITSDHLQTLDFNFWTNITLDAINKLAPILILTPNLRLHFSSLEILQFVSKLLHNNTNIRNLQLRTNFITPSDPFNSLGQIILPELQFLSCTEPFLLQVLRAPKLSSLDLFYDYPVLLENPTHEKFHFASTRYLHILDRQDGLYSILGLKEPIHLKGVFSVKPEKDFLDEILFIEGADGIADNNGILSDTWPPGLFRFGFYDDRILAESVKGALFSLLPRLTGLLELCLASNVISGDKEFHLDKFLTQIPSLRKLIVPYGNGLMDFIRCLTTDTSICPHLDYLSYTTSHPSDSEREEEIEPETLGEILTECVQKRRKVYNGALRYIALGNCPPLPDVWYMELQKLGTTVIVTESVTDRMHESDSPEPSDSELSEED